MLLNEESIIICFCVCVVVCTNVDERNMMPDNSNMMSVRLPNVNDVGRGFSSAQPMMKTQQTYIRALPPPQQMENPVNGIMSHNMPSSFFGYELFKSYPQLRQPVCLPKTNYAPSEMSCPIHNNIPQMQPQDDNRNRMLQIQVPPGLPMNTVSKLDKLVTTINKSLMSICGNVNDNGCEVNDATHYHHNNVQQNDNRNEKRWVAHEEHRDVTNEENNEEYETLKEDKENTKWKRSTNEGIKFDNRFYTLIEELKH